MVILLFCEGESVTLNVSGTGPYQWSLNGAVIAGQSGNSMEANQSGDYAASTTNEFCPNESNIISVLLQDNIPVEITPGDDVYLCENNVLLQAATSGSVQWMLDGQPIAGATQASLLATADGDYQFESSAAGFCPSISDEIHVSLNNTLDILVEMSDDTICVGEKSTITAIGVFDEILWSTGETTNPIEVTEAGIYTVHVSFENCEADSTVRLAVIELPVVSAGEDLISPCDGNLNLSGTGEGELSWYFETQLLGDSSEVVVEAPAVNTIYTLHGNSNGCTSTDDVLVEADCISIYIPNAMTPNDDGVNDVFKVEARGVFSMNFLSSTDGVMLSSTPLILKMYGQAANSIIMFPMVCILI